KEVLAKAWHSTIEYLDVLNAHRTTDILTALHPAGIRLTTRPKPGQIGAHTADQTNPALFSYHSIPVIAPSHKGKHVKLDFALRATALIGSYQPITHNGVAVAYLHPELDHTDLTALPWRRGTKLPPHRPAAARLPAFGGLPVHIHRHLPRRVAVALRVTRRHIRAGQPELVLHVQDVLTRAVQVRRAPAPPRMPRRLRYPASLPGPLEHVLHVRGVNPPPLARPLIRRLPLREQRHLSRHAVLGQLIHPIPQPRIRADERVVVVGVDRRHFLMPVRVALRGIPGDPGNVTVKDDVRDIQRRHLRLPSRYRARQQEDRRVAAPFHRLEIERTHRGRKVPHPHRRRLVLTEPLLLVVPLVVLLDRIIQRLRLQHRPLLAVQVPVRPRQPLHRSYPPRHSRRRHRPIPSTGPLLMEVDITYDRLEVKRLRVQPVVLAEDIEVRHRQPVQPQRPRRQRPTPD